MAKNPVLEALVNNPYYLGPPGTSRKRATFAQEVDTQIQTQQPELYARLQNPAAAPAYGETSMANDGPATDPNERFFDSWRRQMAGRRGMTPDAISQMETSMRQSLAARARPKTPPDDDGGINDGENAFQDAYPQLMNGQGVIEANQMGNGQWRVTYADGSQWTFFRDGAGKRIGMPYYPPDPALGGGAMAPPPAQVQSGGIADQANRIVGELDRRMGIAQQPAASFQQAAPVAAPPPAPAPAPMAPPPPPSMPAPTSQPQGAAVVPAAGGSATNTSGGTGAPVSQGGAPAKAPGTGPQPASGGGGSPMRKDYGHLLAMRANRQRG